MKVNIHTLLSIAIMGFIALVIILLDIDLITCFFTWWKIMAFDILLLILIAVIYTQLTRRSINNYLERTEDERYD